MFKLQNGIYITEEAYNALDAISCGRSREQLAQTSNEIYKTLKEKYCQLNRDGAAGSDSIMLMVERKTGKTEAVIRLADELGLPIITERRCTGLYNDRKEDIKVIYLDELKPEKWTGKSYFPHTVLVDQPTDAKRVRKALTDMAPRWGQVNILGIQ